MLQSRSLALAMVPPAVVLFASAALSNVEDLPEKGALGEGTHAVFAMLYSADGEKLFVGDVNYVWGSTITVWNLDTKSQESRVPFPSVGVITSMDAHPKKDLMALGALPGGVILWDPATWEQYRLQIKPEHEMVASVAFEPNGERLAARYGDGVVRVWNVQTLQVERTLHPSAKKLLMLQDKVLWSPDGKTLVTAPFSAYAAECPVEFWDMAQEEPNAEVVLIKAPGISAMAFSADSRSLALGDTNGMAHILNVANKEVRETFTVDAGFAVTTVSFGRDADTLVAGGPRSVKLWQGGEQKAVYTFEKPRIPILAYSPARDEFAIAASAMQPLEYTITLWNPSRKPSNETRR